MERKVPVSVWLIVAVAVVVVFLVFQAYLKPCQPRLNGSCNTVWFGYCCTANNLVCYNQKCIQLP